MRPLARASRPAVLAVASAVALLAWVGMLAAEADASRGAREGARRAAMAGALAVQPYAGTDGSGAAGVLAMAHELGVPLGLYRGDTLVAGTPAGGDAVRVDIAGTDLAVAAPEVDPTAGLGLTRYSGPITGFSLAVFLTSSVTLLVVVRRGRRRVSALERRFVAVAAADESTGLGNRARLLEDLDAMSSAVRRYGHRLAVATFEIDGPHDEADVRSVAAIVAAQARSADRCYRLPGGRLVSVLPEQDAAGAAVAAERVRAAVEQTGGWTVSVGLAAFDPHRDIAPSDVLDRALAACHRAHEAGGDLLAIGEAAPV